MPTWPRPPGAVLDGVSGKLGDGTEILVRDGLIAEIGRSVDRPDGAEMIDLSERTVVPEPQRPVLQRGDTRTRRGATCRCRRRTGPGHRPCQSCIAGHVDDGSGRCTPDQDGVTYHVSSWRDPDGHRLILLSEMC